MTKLRVGVIGAGWWATDHHVPGILSYPDAELTAICDPHEGRLAAAAQAYSIPQTFASYGEMLNQARLDAAIVVTPHATHYEIARACLQAGLHVLIEKPMTLYARHARELMDLAQAGGRVVTLGYAHNFNHAALRAREAIQSGELGPVQHVEASFSSDMTRFLGGEVSTENPFYTRFKVSPPSENYNRPELLGGGHGQLQMTHVAGVLFYVSGLRVKTVQAQMATFGRAVDMGGAFALSFENGAIGYLGGTGATPGIHREAVSIFCASGMFWADSQAGQAHIRRSDGSKEELKLLPTYPDTRYNTTHNFLDAILGRQPSQAPGEVGLRAVELLDAAYLSARAGGRLVDVNELYE
jgi:predicted dehydrogenase